MKYDAKNIFIWMKDDIFENKQILFRKNDGEWRKGKIDYFITQGWEARLSILLEEKDCLGYLKTETTKLFYSHEVGYDSKNNIYQIKVYTHNQKFDIYEIKI